MSDITKEFVRDYMEFILSKWRAGAETKKQIGSRVTYSNQAKNNKHS